MEEFEKIAQLEFEDMEPLPEGEAAADFNEDASLEVDEDPAETDVDGAQEKEALQGMEEEGVKEEGIPTAGMADREVFPAEKLASTEQTEQAASAPADDAASNPAEVAPAAPYPLEQAETETVPHD